MANYAPSFSTTGKSAAELLESETEFQLRPAHFDVVYKTVIFVVGFQVTIGKTAIKVFAEAQFPTGIHLPREI